MQSAGTYPGNHQRSKYAFFVIGRWATTHTLALAGDIIVNMGGAPTPEERNPALAAGAFIRDFEAQYGTTHPAFIEGSYNEVCRASRSDGDIFGSVSYIGRA